ncbi:hypothetical protein [Erythrobacter alti]|uniref:hypothetical protein n=1 Tax=Erythrobacter alti TaxID=1896145 RepID=UPI0030F44330
MANLRIKILEWSTGTLKRVGATGRAQARECSAKLPHVKMFVLSHVLGPFIGLGLAAALLVLGYPANFSLIGFATLSILFWAYPVALTRGCPYELLCLVSLEHLLITILWAAFFYGGATSPFLLWLAIVPLLAFLYSAQSTTQWVTLLALLSLNIGMFVILVPMGSPTSPGGLETMYWLAFLSFIGASIYVVMMAFYLGRVLDSRDIVELEVAEHRAIEATLATREMGLRSFQATKIAGLARLVKQGEVEVAKIIADCSQAAESTNGASIPLSNPELENIRTAALRFEELLGSINRYEFPSREGLK